MRHVLDKAFEYLIPQLVGGTYQCWQKPVTAAGPVGLMVWQRTPTTLDVVGEFAYDLNPSGQYAGLPTNWFPAHNGAQGMLLKKGYSYRFRPSSDATTGHEAFRSFIGDYDALGDAFTILIQCACKEDLNDDGVINTGDLTILLNQFGRNQPACAAVSPTNPILNADINGSGAVTTDDLTLLLVRFGKVCPAMNASGECGAYTDPGESLMGGNAHPGSSLPHGYAVGVNADHAVQHQDGADENGNGAPGQQLNVAPPTGPLLSALGFDTPEQYQTYVDALTPEQQLTHIQFLIALARALGYE